MIQVPSFSTLPHARLYRDSTDSGLTYVDVLKPAPVRGDAVIRWLPIPDSLAYLVGEIRFASSGEGFDDVQKIAPRQRLIPIPWEIVPVFAWYREGDGVQLVARGKTSGFGACNAVLNGTAPLKAMISPVLVSAELVCSARLADAQINGGGSATAVQRALRNAALGERAAWDTALGNVLVDMFVMLLKSADVSLEVEVNNPRSDTADARTSELYQIALLEWSRRIQRVIAPELTLAAPAALVKHFDLGKPLTLDLDWSADSTLSLRAVRIWSPGHNRVHAHV